MKESLLTLAVGELGAGDLRTLLARTERSRDGTASELRPRLREAVRAGELAPEDVLRRLDEDALLALWEHSAPEEPRSKKHADLLHGLAAAIKKEPPEHARKRPRRGSETLEEMVDRLLDERAKLEAKLRRIEHDLDRERSDRVGLDLAPDDLAELLRGIGIPDANAYRRLYRPAAKLLHPDKSKDGEAAFRLLTRIRDILEGK